MTQTKVHDRFGGIIQNMWFRTCGYLIGLHLKFWNFELDYKWCVLHYSTIICWIYGSTDESIIIYLPITVAAKKQSIFNQPIHVSCTGSLKTRVFDSVFVFNCKIWIYIKHLFDHFKYTTPSVFANLSWLTLFCPYWSSAFND